jgi:hypothetical protein
MLQNYLLSDLDNSKIVPPYLAIGFHEPILSILDELGCQTLERKIFL